MKKKTQLALHQSLPPSRARTRLGMWREPFLEALGKTISYTAAAKAVGVSRRTVLDHRKKDPKFDAACADALEEALDLVEHAARNAALGGDVRAMELILKAHRPIYRDRHEIAVAGGVVILPALKDGPE